MGDQFDSVPGSLQRQSFQTARPTLGHADWEDSNDLQGWATFLFSLPFVLFSGYAGFLSDRFSKTPIIVWAKVAEIVIMGLGLLAFMFYGKFGMAGLGPFCFDGYAKCLFWTGKVRGATRAISCERPGSRQWPDLDGDLFVDHFWGRLCRYLFENLVIPINDNEGKKIGVDPAYLWMGSAICIVIAIAGTLTSLMIRTMPAAQPKMRLTWDALGVCKEILELLKRDRPLLTALAVSSVFWMVATLASPTINRVGSDMLNLRKELVGVLVGMFAIGIMTGGPIGGWLCRRIPSYLAVRIGLWGIFGCLVALGAWTDQGTATTLLGIQGAHVVLVLLGIFAAIYSIPVSVFLQERPPNELKGRMIATMNQANFGGMMLAGPIYQLYEWLSQVLELPICSVFWMIAVLVLPPAIFFRLGETISGKAASDSAKTI